MRINNNFFRGYTPTVFGRKSLLYQIWLYSRWYVKQPSNHSHCIPKGNLPGWRWARIKQLALVGSSSSRHSEVCNALGGPSGVAHSIISVHGYTRSRGTQPFPLQGLCLYSRWYWKWWFIRRLDMVSKTSTVLEQDHFCSDFLCSHETVLTNSQYHEDELSCGSTGKRRPGLCSTSCRTEVCDVDEHQLQSWPQGAEWWRAAVNLGFILLGATEKKRAIHGG